MDWWVPIQILFDRDGGQDRLRRMGPSAVLVTFHRLDVIACHIISVGPC
jgi:hypothetical protein